MSGDAMWLVESSDGSWGLPVRIALDRRSRIRGLRPEANAGGLVLRTRSVHGFGMRRSLGVLALDDQGRVHAATRLRPRRIVTIRAARWIVELPADHPPPERGAELVLLRRILRS